MDLFASEITITHHNLSLNRFCLIFSMFNIKSSQMLCRSVFVEEDVFEYEQEIQMNRQVVLRYNIQQSFQYSLCI